MLDAHCHLSFLAAQGLSAFKQSIINAGSEHAVQFMSCTVSPEDYLHAQFRMIGVPGVQIGCGLHPWWVSADQFEAQYQAEQVCDSIQTASFVGEIGLDFSSKHIDTKDNQLLVFKKICEAVARVGNKTLSIHSVQATEDTLSLLSANNVFSNNRVIFHWFSGSQQHLQQALELGVFFSINPRMVESKKGSAYVKLIPFERMLVETDMPSENGHDFAWADFKVELTQLVYAIAQIKSTTVEEAFDKIYATESLFI